MTETIKVYKGRIPRRSWEYAPVPSDWADTTGTRYEGYAWNGLWSLADELGGAGPLSIYTGISETTHYVGVSSQTESITCRRFLDAVTIIPCEYFRAYVYFLRGGCGSGLRTTFKYSIYPDGEFWATGINTNNYRFFLLYPYIDEQLGRLTHFNIRLTNDTGTGYLIDEQLFINDFSTISGFMEFSVIMSPTKISVTICDPNYRDTKTYTRSYSGDYSSMITLLGTLDTYTISEADFYVEESNIGGGDIVISGKDIDYSQYYNVQEDEFMIVDAEGNILFTGMFDDPVELKNMVRLEFKEITQQLDERTCKRTYKLDSGVVGRIQFYA